MREVLAAVGLVLFLAGCQSETERPAQQSPVQNQPEIEDSTAVARQAAQALIGDFSTRLRTELVEAIQSRGASGAIGVCAEIAPAVADSHSIDGWRIARVSDRNRNPENRATLVEQEIMQQFVADSTPPFIEGWAETDSGTVYQYFQPIKVQPLCLNCHGGIQTLAPGVMTAVRKKYPLDKATGYQIGDLRGMFVVEAHWPVVRTQFDEEVSDQTDTTGATR